MVFIIAPGARPVNAKLKSRVVMTYPVSPYIDERNGGLYVAGTRVSLDSVVIHFQEGASPERIVQSFPTLKLFQVYGAIAYYLEHELVIREYIAEGERELELSVPPLSQTDPALFARLEAARRQTNLKRA
jgi:uncharacterized protein (DUF433 family)